jgi:hypothetical protein
VVGIQKEMVAALEVKALGALAIASSFKRGGGDWLWIAVAVIVGRDRTQMPVKPHRGRNTTAKGNALVTLGQTG